MFHFIPYTIGEGYTHFAIKLATHRNMSPQSRFTHVLPSFTIESTIIKLVWDWRWVSSDLGSLSRFSLQLLKTKIMTIASHVVIVPI